MQKKKATVASNTPNREELFNMAVEAAKNRDSRKGARMMFRQVLEQNRRDYRAMMWLAKLAPNEKEKEAWLKRVLEVKSDYLPAHEALEKMTYDKLSKRNKLYLQIGAGSYVAVVSVVCLLIILSSL